MTCNYPGHNENVGFSLSSAQVGQVLVSPDCP